MDNFPVYRLLQTRAPLRGYVMKFIELPATTDTARPHSLVRVSLSLKTKTHRQPPPSPLESVLWHTLEGPIDARHNFASSGPVAGT